MTAMVPWCPLLMLMVAAATHAASATTQSNCLSSCKNQIDGDYQSCKGCHIYASCTNGHLIDGRPCPSGLVWDDIIKKCYYSSSTCRDTRAAVDISGGADKHMTAAPLAATENKVPAASRECINSCKNISNGNYPSCLGCEYYASCSDGVLIDAQPCPGGLIWDDHMKACNYQSASTCKVLAKTYQCVKSCRGVPNGDYQSCEGCSVYASCSDGLLHDRRPCPAGLVWDDHLKRCEYKSNTCTTSMIPDPASSSATHYCVNSCLDMRDGNYQSCNGCRVFATCTNGVLVDNRPCPSRLVWDNKMKKCLFKSSTCVIAGSNIMDRDQPGRCVSDCSGKLDGDYQSCKGCHIYASCTNGHLVDKRPCPARLVWDDRVKRCSHGSSTCVSRSP